MTNLSAAIHEATYPEPVKWTGTPGKHQEIGVDRCLNQGMHALFWDPGAGKTYGTLHVAKTFYLEGLIDLLVVICPNSVKQVWPPEAEKWMPGIDLHIQVMAQGLKPVRPKNFKGLEILVVAIESLSAGGMFAKIMEYIKGRKPMCALDEASKIKNPTSNRTKNATKIGWSCYYRYILTGTPVTQGPHDLYAQFRFLDPKIIGIDKWTAFRARYCEMGGFENRQIVAYRNLDELMDKIRPYAHYVKLEECTDIPEKIYHKIRVDLSPEQRAAISELKEEGSIVVEALGVELYVEMALERMTRIQQIVGGSLPHMDAENGGYKVIPMPGKNPKMEALLNYIEELPAGTKAMVWARFEPERERIYNELAKLYGAHAVQRFDGSTDENTRKSNVLRMQNDPTLLFLVGNPTVMGIGLTLTAAKYSLMFSNTFSREDRVQLENRNHRTGQTNHCVYVDFEANVKEDRMILKAVEAKQKLSDMVEDSIRRGELVLT